MRLLGVCAVCWGRFCVAACLWPRPPLLPLPPPWVPPAQQPKGAERDPPCPLACELRGLWVEPEAGLHSVLSHGGHSRTLL